MNLFVWSMVCTGLIVAGIAALVVKFAVEHHREREAPTVEPLDANRLRRPRVHVERSPYVNLRRHAVWTVPSRPIVRTVPCPSVRPAWATWPTAEYAPAPRPRPPRRPAPRPRDPRCTRTVILKAVPR